MKVYDLKEFDEYVNKGLLRKAEDEFLVQYNYTDLCNYKQMWDDVTLFNRGNIYEKSTGKLIAKAMPKFFNFSQLSEKEQEAFLRFNNFICTEKKDGCLGIIYKYKDEIRCNSRGDFNNYVTDAMKRIIKKYKNLDIILSHNTSLNVEVISPQTRIVCDYGGEENLYLLSAYTELKDYWVERSVDELDRFSVLSGMPRPSYGNYTWDELFDWAKKADYSKEGFVVTIDSLNTFNAYGRVKIKSEDYLRVARVKASLTKHMIWKQMKYDLKTNKETFFLNDYIQNIPDEFTKLAKHYIDEIEKDLEVLRVKVREVAEKTKDLSNKELAQYLQNNYTDIKGAIFNLRNGKNIDGPLINLVEPALDECADFEE